MGENASLSVSGVAMTAASIGTVAKYGGLAKWGGEIAFYGFVAAEGIAIVKDFYQWEHLSEGHKYVALIRHGSNVLLIVAFKVKDPRIAIPMAVVGVAGHVVAYFVDKYYTGLEEEQKRQIRVFIYQHYGVSQ